MADWTTLSNTAVGVGGLPSGATITALRDNPIAIAEGAVGAPRVVDGALDTTVLTAGVNWVLNRNAVVLAEAKGTEIVAWNGSATDIAINGTIAGSSLYYNVNVTALNPFSTLVQSSFSPIPTNLNGLPLTGTWRARTACPGKYQDGSSNWQFTPTMWLRIS
jgi:hypothetical protein